MFLSYSDVVRPSTEVAPLFLSSSRPCHLPPLDPCDVRSHLSFTLASFWRLRWRQLLFSSLRLFRELGSLSFMMISFSDRQTSHFRPPGSYFWHFFRISHFTSFISTPSSLLSQGSRVGRGQGRELDKDSGATSVDGLTTSKKDRNNCSR